MVMGLRMPPEWLSQADERILEYFSEENTASAEMMGEDDRIDLNKNYITQRLSILYQSSLLEKTARGVYRITPKGEAYLAGQEDLRDLERPE